jgi:DNA repair exonuclease SbcCD nuclease subunit
MEKYKIAFFTDLHIGVHQNNENWLDVTYKWAEWFTLELKQKNINKIIFGGDLFHYRDEISVKTLEKADTLLDLFNDFELYMIPGNHDAYYRDNSSVHSLSILKNRKNIKIFDKPTSYNLAGKQIGFCPWGTEIKDIPDDCDLIVGHFEMENFNFNNRKICEEGLKSTDLIKKSKLIFSGHFHKRQQRKFDNGTIVYAGNPFEMDFNDIKDQKGYYILDFEVENINFNFYENNITPIHVKVNLTELETLKKIAKNKGWSNLAIKVTIDREIKTNLLDKIISAINFEGPFSLTTDYLHKFSIGDNINISNDLGDLNIKECIIEYIDSLDIEDKTEVAKKTITLYNNFV